MVDQVVADFGYVDDVAEVVAYLCSDGAGYLTGQRIYVDGGGPGPSSY